jgi:hypothetical protein
MLTTKVQSYRLGKLWKSRKEFTGTYNSTKAGTWPITESKLSGVNSLTLEALTPAINAPTSKEKESLMMNG